MRLYCGMWVRTVHGVSVIQYVELSIAVYVGPSSGAVYVLVVRGRHFVTRITDPSTHSN